MDAARASSKYSASHSQLEKKLPQASPPSTPSPFFDVGHYLRRFLTPNIEDDEDNEDDKSIDEEDEGSGDATLTTTNNGGSTTNSPDISSHEHYQFDDKQSLPTKRSRLNELSPNDDDGVDLVKSNDDTSSDDWSHESLGSNWTPPSPLRTPSTAETTDLVISQCSNTHCIV